MSKLLGFNQRKSQRPRFRGKGLLTEGAFDEIRRINIPPQHATARLLLKETLIPNVVNNTLEVTGTFAVSSTASSKGGYIKPYRSWSGNLESWNTQVIFDKRLATHIETGRFAFLTHHFPIQDHPQETAFHLPVPDDYILGIHGVCLERIGIERMLPKLPLSDFWSGSISNQRNVEFQRKLLVSQDYPVFYSRDVIVSPYESPTTSIVSLEVTGGRTKSEWEMNMEGSEGESVGNRLLLTFGNFDRALYGDNDTTMYYQKYGRLRWNDDSVRGFPILQFYRYRYVITLKPSDDETDVYEYIQNLYLSNTNLSSEDWDFRVKDLAPRRAPIEGFDDQTLSSFIQGQPSFQALFDNPDKPNLYTSDETSYVSFVRVKQYIFRQYGSVNKIVFHPTNSTVGDKLSGNWNTVLVDGQRVPLSKHLKSKLIETFTTDEQQAFTDLVDTYQVELVYDIEGTDAQALSKWVNLEQDWFETKLSEE